MRRLCCLLLLIGGCEATSPQEYVEIVEGARECSADDECVLAGECPCVCLTPVNKASEELVNEEAANVDCEGATTTMCPDHANVRCENSRCISDGST